jgi:hypothetical protein
MKRNALAWFVADSLKRPTNNSTLISLDRGKLYLWIEEQH